MTDHVVKIIAPEAVLYSLDRGFTLNEFEPGEFYAVPDYVADGMIRRGWAAPANPKDAELSAPKETEAAIDQTPPEPSEASAPVEDHPDHKTSKKRSK